MTRPEKTLRAVLYSRVSTTKQSIDGASLETQEAMAREYCTAHGWELGAVYVDALSGKKDNRPDFQRLLAAAKGRPRPFDVVLIYKVDRLSRRARWWYEAFGILEDAGIEIKSLTQAIGSTREGRMMLHFLIMAAEMESETIGERVKDSFRYRAGAGTWVPTCTPLGYRYVRQQKGPGGEKVPGRVEVVEEDAAVIRYMFDLYLDLRSARGVAVELNRQGHRAKLGGPWTSGRVANSLRNPTYMGDRVFGRHSVAWRGRTRCVVRTPHARWMVRAGEMPAIIDRDTWLRVNAILDQNKRAHPREAYALSRHTWSGILRCACGSAMTRCHYTDKAGCELERWVCRKAHATGKSLCPYYSATGAPFLDKDVVSTIAAAVDKAGGNSVRGNAPPLPAPRPPVARAKRIAELEEQRQRLNRLYMRGKIADDEYDREDEAITREVAALSEAQEPVPPPPVPRLGRSFREVWDALEPAERRELLALFVDHIETGAVDGKRIVTIFWQPLVGRGWPTKPTVIPYRQRRRWQKKAT